MKISSIIISLIFISCNSQVIKSNNDFNLKGGVRIVEETTKYPDYEIKSIYSLNEDDYVLTTEDYNVYNLIEKKLFKYDENRIIHEIEVIDSKGKEISKSTFQKNKKNQIEKTLINSRNGKSAIIHYYKIDSEFPDSGKEVNDKGEITRSWRLAYKNNLVSIQENLTSAGIIASRTTFVYNDNNDLFEVIEKDKDGKDLYRQYSEYKYDYKKNWIEKKVYDSEKNLISTSTRKISYW